MTKKTINRGNISKKARRYVKTLARQKMIKNRLNRLRKYRVSQSLKNKMKSPPEFKTSYFNETLLGYNDILSVNAEQKNVNPSNNIQTAVIDENSNEIGIPANLDNATEVLSPQEEFNNANETNADNLNSSDYTIEKREIEYTHEQNGLQHILSEECFIKISTDLLLFLEDRLKTIDEILPTDIQWTIAIVDLLDELRMMKKGYTETDIIAVNLLQERVLNLLSYYHTEIIDLDEWTPTKQRAISVKKDPSISDAKIMRKGASGIVLDGKLIRKQEVFLSIPINQ